MSTSTDIRVRRVYEDPEPEDGQRVLVDRLWPRGISKEHAKLDLWAKDIAPSAELRKWYGHDPALFDEFSQRYRDELADPAHAETLATLTRMAGTVRLTLLTGSKACVTICSPGAMRAEMTEAAGSLGF